MAEPRWFQATRIADGYVTRVAGEPRFGGNYDEAAYGPDQWSVFELDREVEEFDASADDGTVALDVAKLDAELHRQIDAEAGAFRLNFITDVPGQAGTYIEKEKQAERFIADASDPADFPMIVGEAAARGISEQAMAEMIVAIAAQWREIDALVENARMGAKLAVSAAATEVEKRAAAVVDWGALLP